MTKNILSSKTIIGAIVMVLPLLGRVFGLDIGDAEAQQIAEAFVTIAGLVLTVYGRAKATKSITVGKGTAGLILALCLVPVLGGASGCAVKQINDLPAHEQARSYVDLMLDTCADVQNAYTEEFYASDNQRKMWLGKNVGKYINEARFALLMAGRAAHAWGVVVSKGEDAALAESQFINLFNDAQKAWATASAKWKAVKGDEQ